MYRLLLPLAYLPLWVHYFFSSLLWRVVYHIVRYRRKVVKENLLRCFPEKTEAERRDIERAYYRHLCDLLVEGIYNMGASLDKIKKHYLFENAEILKPYYDQNRSVILASAHYNNWEYMITSLNSRINHHAVGVGKPLDNRGIGRFITGRRSRYGTEIVDQTDVRRVMDYFHLYNVPVAYMMLSDQSPSNPHRSFWTEFLGQDTPFLFGAEHFAKKYNMPVILYDVAKVHRGHYRVHFELMTDEPNSLPDGEITRRYVQHLETQIRRQPQYWLWSHRRWKLTHNGRILKDGTIKIIEK